MVEQVLGWIATVIFSFMLVPQIVKTVRTRSLEGVSIGTHGMYLLGNVVAIVYAGMIFQWPLIIKYALAIVSALVFFVVVLSIRRGMK